MPFKLTKIKEVDAMGGPDAPVKGGDGFSMTPTRVGRYVIQIIEKHVSQNRYGYWSGVPWGTPMRLNKNITEVKMNNIWKPLTAVNIHWGKYQHAQSEVTKTILERYRDLNYVGVFPDKWVFSDFGHVAVKYFKDLNHNGRFDGKESIMGDFIHTTPDDEARTARKEAFTLQGSHGCIHVKPNDIDALITAGYIKKGNNIEVHEYSERTISLSLTRDRAKQGYEVHFYPGIHKIVIYRVA